MLSKTLLRRKRGRHNGYARVISISAEQRTLEGHLADDFLGVHLDFKCESFWPKLQPDMFACNWYLPLASNGGGYCFNYCYFDIRALIGFTLRWAIGVMGFNFSECIRYISSPYAHEVTYIWVSFRAVAAGFGLCDDSLLPLGLVRAAKPSRFYAATLPSRGRNNPISRRLWSTSFREELIV